MSHLNGLLGSTSFGSSQYIKMGGTLFHFILVGYTGSKKNQKNQIESNAVHDASSWTGKSLAPMRMCE